MPGQSFGPSPQPLPGQGMPAVPQQSQGQAPSPDFPYTQQQAPATPYVPPSNPKGKAPDVVPPPPPRPTSPYDFFMENQPRKPINPKGLLPNKLPGNKFVWIGAAAVAALLLMTVTALFAPKADPKLSLIAVAVAQTETLRICTKGDQEAKLQPTKSFAINCSLVQTTERRELTAALSKVGIKTGEKVLEQGKNAKSDQQLSSAKSSSAYDETFKEVAKSQLTSQSRAIKAALTDPTTTATERKLLNKYTESTQLLVQQLEQ